MSHTASLWLWLTVGCGGFVGAIARYALSGWVVKRFPMGTLAVNVVGCLLIGLFMATSVRTKWVNQVAQAFWVAGFLGALTTFSTFGYQSVLLYRQDGLHLALANISSNLILGLLAVWIGLFCGESLIVPFLEGGVKTIDSGNRG